MKHRLSIILLFLFLMTSLVMGQSVLLSPYGVSPRDAGLDDADIFDVAYNGLLNVGVETKMYFKGMRTDADLESPAWMVIMKPDGSVADIMETMDMDAQTQIAAFKPDVVGIYKIEFSEGDLKDTLSVHAGLYMGIEEGKCGLCHSGKKAEWEETGHYEIFEEGMKGTLSDHYAGYCIECHTTGYDAMANNNGFDDRFQYVDMYGKDTTFVFPDSALW